ncbi:MAG TPA: hypothetical protein VGM83_15935 [Devosiaceae bacterium]|jgi:hypothetical protein
MAIDSPSDVTVVTAPVTRGDAHSYVDWPAIIAGIILASAISLILLTFGSAVGLSFVNFQAGPDVNPIWIAIAAASWLLWVQISSFMAGGYLTGRLRRRAFDATEHESDVRDGAHGLLVWAGALVIGAIVAVSGVGAAATAVGSVASTLTSAASNVAGEAAGQGNDPTAYFVDTLFRPAAPAAAPAGAAATPAAPGTPVPPADVAAPTPSTNAVMPMMDMTASKAEAGRILVQNALSGEFSADDKAYLAQLVSNSTGMPEADAKARVDQVLASIDSAKQQAADAAEKARKTAVLAAFLTAASLLVSALGAYWASTMGGRHRDEGTVFADVFRRF